jgi:hypothetical protein
MTVAFQLLSLTGTGGLIVTELADIADHNDQQFFSCLAPMQ